MKKILMVLLPLPFLWTRTFCQTLQAVTDNGNPTTNRVAIGEADGGVSQFQVKGGTTFNGGIGYRSNRPTRINVPSGFEIRISSSYRYEDEFIYISTDCGYNRE